MQVGDQDDLAELIETDYNLRETREDILENSVDISKTGDQKSSKKGKYTSYTA
jgi:hypothetical protein